TMALWQYQKCMERTLYVLVGVTARPTLKLLSRILVQVCEANGLFMKGQRDETTRLGRDVGKFNDTSLYDIGQICVVAIVEAAALAVRDKKLDAAAIFSQLAE